jgi:endonuclease-8
VPEGDTVWLAAQRLREALAGRVITASDFRVPALATVDLAGVRIEDVVPRGKHLLFRLDDGRTLHTHFRMDGSWHLYRPDVPWRGGPGHSVRVVLSAGEWTAVGYRLPVIALLSTADEASVVGHLGPDILGPDWDPEEARRRIATSPGTEIGQALLDQRNLAGIGLIYQSETLFLCGINPFTQVAEVPDLSDVLRTATRLMKRNAPRPSQSTTGDERRPHYVYGRAGRSCLRCGSRVRTAKQGQAPRERDAYWCAVCQPAPDRATLT